MGNNFLSATANFDDFANLQSAEINSHVQKNNDVILKKVFNFFQTESKILFINGFAGVGKKQITEHTISYLDKNVIVLKYNCVESSALDDVLLTFSAILKQKTSLGQYPEADAIENVRDKVEYFFNKSEFKFVLVFYNTDVLKPQNFEDITSYINSMALRESFRVVVCSKTFDTDKIPENIKYVKVVVKALSKNIFEEYIKEFGIKVTPAMLDQLYRLTRGYFFSTCLCIKYMINQELSLKEFIVQYTNSGENFDIFLAKSYYRLIVGTTRSAFNLFIKMHHGLNLKILQTIGSYPEIIFKTLSENFYVYKSGKNYYPNEFLKMQLAKNAPVEITNQRLVSYYKKQLELSPEERDVLISRASLQDEIAFYEGLNIEVSEETQQKSDTASVANDYAKTSVVAEGVETKEKVNEYDAYDSNELYEKALSEFKAFSYPKTIDVLTNLLDRKESIEPQMVYDSYSMLAKTFSKLTKWGYALYYYDLLEKHYASESDTENVNKIQYEKAYIYYQSYKIIDAIKVLKNLVSCTKQDDVIVKSSVLLGNIALSASNKSLALEYYDNGLKHVNDVDEPDLLMELYFKYAVLSDENGDMDKAIEYYKKCVELNSDKCKYLALAYSNMGDLFLDNELFAEAKDCFDHAYNADMVNENYYGMYYSLSKLLELTDKKEKDLRLSIASKAKECALKTDDYNAVLLSVINLGDEYYNYPQPEKALAEYLALYNEGVEVLEEPNFSMIKARIEDIKARMSEEDFERLAPGYGKS